MWRRTLVEMFINFVDMAIRIYTNMFYNYFAPIVSVFVQAVGYYLQEKRRYEDLLKNAS